MQMYQCPICHNRSVAWDARSGVFACYITACGCWFRPPSIHEICLPNIDVAAAISSGTYTVTQEWLNRQPAAKLNAYDRHKTG